MCVCVSLSVMSPSLRLHGLQHARLLCPWDFPGKSTGVGCHFLLQNISLSPFLGWGGGGKNTGVGCHSLLQEIFPTQGLNPGLPHCRQTLYRLNHQGSLECAIAEHKIATFVQLPGDFTCSIQQIELLQCSCSKRSHCNLILFSFIENQFCVWFTAIHN